MRHFLILLLFIFITSCNKNNPNTNYKSSTKLKLADEIRNKVAIKLRKEKELYPCGTGGQMMDEIKMLALSFYYYKQVDIEEGRKLLLSATNDFVAAVNEDNRIYPYLNNHPFTPKNIEIAIFLHDLDGRSFGSGKLCVIAMKEGILQYNITDPETDRMKTIYAETYEEALEKLGQKEASKLSSEKHDIVWQDLRIQELLPEYLVFPAIEPYLPKNFIALSDPRKERTNDVYWGDKEVLENIFQKSADFPNSAVIKANISLRVAQTDENSFSSDEDTLRKALTSQGAKNIVINKWRWGSPPVLSCDAKCGDSEAHFLWIGLNYASQVLNLILYYPTPGNTPTKEGPQLWSDFIKKTRPLDVYETIKSTGQDLRDGLTLVNVYGSILKVSAEKRTRDNKVRAIIKSEDGQISCKVLSISEGTMGLAWHLNDPLLKIDTLLNKTGTENITSHKTISVLLREVSEFSYDQNDLNSNEISINNYSILNCCK